MVYELDEELWFPNPIHGEPDGLIAIGGDLSVDRLLLAYYYGIFPWYSFRDSEEPYWYCPLQRFVIFPSEIHISHSMRTLMNKGRYRCTFNEDFDGVIRNCSELRYNQQGAWLGENIIEAYTELHHQHLATSVEVWDEDKLVGGLYGVSIGRSFFGESMFSLVPSASKLALIFLAEFLVAHDGGLIDCQFETPHLRSMGGRYISYDEYLSIIHDEKTTENK
ncbi:MAG: leucyl/phenylalanyl-tRNA--protein transferase [Prevotella sp.]|nr:leucyl/phenylalanyl-tRNA--protein transferase [Prevotella sp.]